MNDVRSLLSETVPQDLHEDGPWPDTEGDLARGRALLVRGRRRRAALTAGTGLVAASAVGALLVMVPDSTSSPSAPRPSTPIAGSARAVEPAPGAVRLVAYTQAQPDGYTLKTIPQGWEVASADDTALVLHRTGTPKGGDYTDKIVIQGDLNPFPKSRGQKVEVNGHKGVYFRNDGPADQFSLIFQTDRKRSIDITPGKADPDDPTLAPTRLNVLVQLPPMLNWDVTTTVRFASGITVADNAQGAVG